MTPEMKKEWSVQSWLQEGSLLGSKRSKYLDGVAVTEEVTVVYDDSSVLQPGQLQQPMAPPAVVFGGAWLCDPTTQCILHVRSLGT